MSEKSMIALRCAKCSAPLRVENTVYAGLDQIFCMDIAPCERCEKGIRDAKKALAYLLQELSDH